LGGTLVVENPAGLNLAQGNSFTFMSVLGTVWSDFDDYFLPPLGGNLTWQGGFDLNGDLILGVA
jgi:hypothetical protein